MKYTSIEQQIEYGLGSIDPNRSVEVNLADLLYVFETLQELQRFFHQPMHYPKIEDVEKFLGSVSDGGAYGAIHKCIHEKMNDMFPIDVSNDYDEGGVFDHPDMPYYYKK